MDRIEKEYKDRLPKIWVDDKGVQWRQTEGSDKPDRLILSKLEGEDLLRTKSGADPLDRIRDNAMDGVDGEVVFPNKGLAMWYTKDPLFAQAQCRIWNDWAWETYGPHIARISPSATVATGDVEGTLKEIERTAKMGFRHVTFPCRPVFGSTSSDDLNYNQPAFDPVWALLSEIGMPITFHVSTGKDPRTVRGPGGAVINYVSHSLAPTIEPLATLCASGVIERFPKLRFGSIEAGIGWLPWMLDAMDEAFLKHHIWVRPQLKMKPSEYFRANGFASFGEDRAGLALIEEFGLQDNCLWANDYPHHEGTWPHSAEAIERDMGALSEATLRKVLGENTARIFGFTELVEEYAAKHAQSA